MRLIAILLIFAVLCAVPDSAQICGHSVARDQGLLAAIKRNDARVVKALLAQGANPNTHERCYWTYIPESQMPTDFRYSKRRTGMQPPSALLIALGIWSTDDPQYYSKRSAASPAVVKALVEAGANVNERDPDTMSTPLMEAVREENAATVSLLLRHGAKINAIDKQGGTALMAAVLPDRNSIEIVKLLLGQGAKPNAMTKQGDRPLTMVRRAEYIPILVHYGANINARDKQGLTVLARVKKEQAMFLPAPDDVVKALRQWGAKE